MCRDVSGQSDLFQEIQQLQLSQTDSILQHYLEELYYPYLQEWNQVEHECSGLCASQ